MRRRCDASGLNMQMWLPTWFANIPQRNKTVPRHKLLNLKSNVRRRTCTISFGNDTSQRVSPFNGWKQENVVDAPAPRFPDAMSRPGRSQQCCMSTRLVQSNMRPIGMTIATLDGYHYAPTDAMHDSQEWRNTSWISNCYCKLLDATLDSANWIQTTWITNSKNTMGLQCACACVGLMRQMDA